MKITRNITALAGVVLLVSALSCFALSEKEKQRIARAKEILKETRVVSGGKSAKEMQKNFDTALVRIANGTTKDVSEITALIKEHGAGAKMLSAKETPYKTIADALTKILNAIKNNNQNDAKAGILEATITLKDEPTNETLFNAILNPYYEKWMKADFATLEKKFEPTGDFGKQIQMGGTDAKEDPADLAKLRADVIKEEFEVNLLTRFKSATTLDGATLYGSLIKNYSTLPAVVAINAMGQAEGTFREKIDAYQLELFKKLPLVSTDYKKVHETIEPLVTFLNPSAHDSWYNTPKAKTNPFNDLSTEFSTAVNKNIDVLEKHFNEGPFKFIDAATTTGAKYDGTETAYTNMIADLITQGKDALDNTKRELEKITIDTIKKPLVDKISNLIDRQQDYQTNKLPNIKKP